MHQQKEHLVHSWLQKILVNNDHPTLELMGSSLLPGNLQDEHNDTYCDLDSTFLSDVFALKSHS